MDKETFYDIGALPPNFQLIARQIGVENFISLTEAVGGRYIFIPKKDNLLRYFHKGQMKEDRSHGMTFQQIADRHGLSVDTVRRTIRG